MPPPAVAAALLPTRRLGRPPAPRATPARVGGLAAVGSAKGARFYPQRLFGPRCEPRSSGGTTPEGCPDYNESLARRNADPHATPARAFRAPDADAAGELRTGARGTRTAGRRHGGRPAAARPAARGLPARRRAARVLPRPARGGRDAGQGARRRPAASPGSNREGGRASTRWARERGRGRRAGARRAGCRATRRPASAWRCATACSTAASACARCWCWRRRRPVAPGSPPEARWPRPRCAPPSRSS